MKVAAYQAPLLDVGSMAAVALIRERVEWCEDNGVEVLCCPEGVLGGLADYSSHPTRFAIDVKSGKLESILAPLKSKTVTTILGFTEMDGYHSLYNTAAVFHKGSVIGLYRKQHTAINRSVYRRGDRTPIFTIGLLTFGIILCRDSVFAEPARTMATKGAQVLFVPTNCGLPPGKCGPDMVGHAQRRDATLAAENGVHIVRADVAGTTSSLTSFGTSRIINPAGTVLAEAKQMVPDLIVADIETTR
ncbi:MAG: carbon-nitrogen hydrolase family protein [Gemmatimonadaceae bacterium]